MISSHDFEPRDFLIQSLSFLLAVAVIAKTGTFENVAHKAPRFP